MIEQNFHIFVTKIWRCFSFCNNLSLHSAQIVNSLHIQVILCVHGVGIQKHLKIAAYKSIVCIKKVVVSQYKVCKWNIYLGRSSSRLTSFMAHILGVVHQVTFFQLILRLLQMKNKSTHFFFINTLDTYVVFASSLTSWKNLFRWKSAPDFFIPSAKWKWKMLWFSETCSQIQSTICSRYFQTSQYSEGYIIT